mmetsp:Transcript_14000/g.40325  ORF Transcript_14000/g.40325 Transcript_14000/m.40325 type:complete len:228 (-) Transcript_14000:1340-2023(-)
MTHHRREAYVGPARMRSDLQPAIKMGRQGRARAMSSWSKQALSNQSLGVRPCRSSKVLAHAFNASHFAAGGSCQLWLMKQSTSPSPHRSVRSAKSAAPAFGPTGDGHAAEPSRRLDGAEFAPPREHSARSSKQRRSNRMQRNSASATWRSSFCVMRRRNEQSDASSAASRSSLVDPSRPSAASAWPRSQGLSKKREDPTREAPAAMMGRKDGWCRYGFSSRAARRPK